MPLMEAGRSHHGHAKIHVEIGCGLFFQWYALFIYWQFISPMLKTSIPEWGRTKR